MANIKVTSKLVLVRWCDVMVCRNGLKCFGPTTSNYLGLRAEMHIRVSLVHGIGERIRFLGERIGVLF